MDAHVNIIPALTATRREMALASSPAEKLVEIVLGLAPLIVPICEGRIDKARVVDEILDSALSTGLTEAVGLETVEQTIAHALNSPPPQNGNGSWEKSEPAAQSTVDALMYSLRLGLSAREPSDPVQKDTLRRLSELSKKQLIDDTHSCCKLLAKRNRPWTKDDLTKLVLIWKKLRK